MTGSVRFVGVIAGIRGCGSKKVAGTTVTQLNAGGIGPSAGVQHTLSIRIDVDVSLSEEVEAS